MQQKLGLDLFAGIDGWGAGARRSGAVDMVAALNHCPDAIATIERSHPGIRTFCQDAGEFPFEVLRDVVGGGWLFASPSCRDFSSAGRPAARGTGGNGAVNLGELAKSRAAARNTSWAVVSAAESLCPEVVLVENVSQWLDWPLFDSWMSAMSALGYELRTHEINAANYGAAIDRTRAIVTCSRVGAIELGESWGGGLAGGSRIGDCLDEWEDAGNRWAAIDSKPERTRDLIRAKQEESGLSRGVLNNVGCGVRMRGLDDLWPSFTTQSGTQLMVIDGDRVRIVNPGEIARGIGYRDGEVSFAGVPRKVASRLVGNSISPDMTEGIVRQALAVAA